MKPVRDRDEMLAQMQPVLRPGRYVFTTINDPAGAAASPPASVRPVMTFTEDEGLTMVLEQRQADAAKLPYDLVTGWITLQVMSALDGVGLTAAVSKLLADAGISCNLVAGTHHDHLFVPVKDATEAVRLLKELSGRRSRRVEAGRAEAGRAEAGRAEAGRAGSEQAESDLAESDLAGDAAAPGVTVEVQELRRALRLLLNEVELTSGGDLDLAADRYWDLEPGSVYDLTADPSAEIVSGQLIDDVDSMRELLARRAGEAVVVGNDLAHVVAILRRIAYLGRPGLRG